MRQDDAKNDVEKVERLFNEFRSGGLGVVGAQDTLSALNNGQVDELILSAARKEIRSEEQDREESPVGEGEQPPVLADTLVTAAPPDVCQSDIYRRSNLIERSRRCWRSIALSPLNYFFYSGVLLMAKEKQRASGSLQNRGTGTCGSRSHTRAGKTGSHPGAIKRENRSSQNAQTEGRQAEGD